MIRARDFFVDRELSGDALTCLGLREPVALHHAPNLLRGIAGRDDDRVEIAVPPDFVQKRDVGDREGMGAAGLQVLGDRA